MNIQAKLSQENLLRMVRWVRWHCPPDTGFEIQTLVVWGRARYLSVTEAPHNTEFYEWMRKKQFCFFQTAETGKRTLSFSVKGGGVNHYTRAPAPYAMCLRPLYIFTRSYQCAVWFWRLKTVPALTFTTLTLTALKHFCINHKDQRFFKKLKSSLNVLVKCFRFIF